MYFCSVVIIIEIVIRVIVRLLGIGKCDCELDIGHAASNASANPAQTQITLSNVYICLPIVTTCRPTHLSINCLMLKGVLWFNTS